MKVLPTYNCTQQELYAVCLLGWQNYLNQQADFAAYKAKYTVKLGNNAIADVLNAKNLPDNVARIAVPESSRVQMKQLANVCLDNWQRLKGYILEAFEKPQQKSKLEAAGAKSYKGASHDKWEKMQALLTSAELFITDNATALEMAGENMPATFPAQFSADKKAFEDQYTTYLLQSQDSVTGTSAKITANNVVANATAKMFADAQIIYKNDPANKDKFKFDYLLGFVTKPGESGLRIVAKEAITEKPIQGLQVTAQPGNVIGTTDENGVLVLSLPQDSYSIIGMKEGYHSFTEEVNVTTGVVSRKSIELSKTA